ncbi:hypothetical protein SNEBB_007773 [Seison nebaliae]|nr:hypothetical protein SNEBB_007773 [Seison nebaliae]
MSYETTEEKCDEKLELSRSFRKLLDTPVYASNTLTNRMFSRCNSNGQFNYKILANLYENTRVAVNVGCDKRNEKREEVAIKSFDTTLPEIHQKYLLALLREQEIHGILKHPNIIKVKEIIKCDVYVHFILQYSAFVDFEAIIERHNRLPPHHVALITYQLSAALLYIHKLNIVHRDIKPSNLLLGNHGQLLLCDMGSACHTPSSRCTDAHGTLDYLAPEICTFKGVPYGLSVDIWSLGCTMFQLVCGDVPFTNTLNGRTNMEGFVSSSKIDHIKSSLTTEDVKELLAKAPNEIHLKFPLPLPPIKYVPINLSFDYEENKQVERPIKTATPNNCRNKKHFHYIQSPAIKRCKLMSHHPFHRNNPNSEEEQSFQQRVRIAAAQRTLNCYSLKKFCGDRHQSFDDSFINIETNKEKENTIPKDSLTLSMTEISKDECISNATKYFNCLLLEINPEKRPKIEKIIKHKWLMEHLNYRLYPNNYQCNNHLTSIYSHNIQDINQSTLNHNDLNYEKVQGFNILEYILPENTVLQATVRCVEVHFS